jgi:hypothetical protein
LIAPCPVANRTQASNAAQATLDISSCLSVIVGAVCCRTLAGLGLDVSTVEDHWYGYESHAKMRLAQRRTDGETLQLRGVSAETLRPDLLRSALPLPDPYR